MERHLRSRAELEAAVGERFIWSVEPCIRQTDKGWTLAFSPDQPADAQAGLNGDFWSDWLATDQPVLLVRGSESRAVDGALLVDMAWRRRNTTLATFEAGHVVHHDKPYEFARSVRAFLDRTGLGQPPAHRVWMWPFAGVDRAFDRTGDARSPLRGPMPFLIACRQPISPSR